jgi:hypothetical protein
MIYDHFSETVAWFVTSVKWRVPLVEQEMLTYPKYLNSPPIFSVVRVA